MTPGTLVHVRHNNIRTGVVVLARHTGWTFVGAVLADARGNQLDELPEIYGAPHNVGVGTNSIGGVVVAHENGYVPDLHLSLGSVVGI